MSTPDYSALNQALKYDPIPKDDNGPVFSEPWEAQAFALTIQLHEKGQFGWAEWAEMLSTVIKEQEAEGIEKSYYEQWLEALERIVASKNMAGSVELNEEQSAWRKAALETPHGEPIELMQAVTDRKSV